MRDRRWRKPGNPVERRQPDRLWRFLPAGINLSETHSLFPFLVSITLACDLVSESPGRLETRNMYRYYRRTSCRPGTIDSSLPLIFVATEFLSGKTTTPDPSFNRSRFKAALDHGISCMRNYFKISVLNHSFSDKLIFYYEGLERVNAYIRDFYFNQGRNNDDRDRLSPQITMISYDD